MGRPDTLTYPHNTRLEKVTTPITLDPLPRPRRHDRVKRMVASSDAQVIIVSAMKRFITQPEVLVPCCLLIRHGLSEERAPRRDQISSLQSLQLVQLLLAVNKSPLHLETTVNTEVCALLSALDISIGTVGEFM